MITRNFSNNKRWELSFLFIAPISRPSIAIIVLWLAFCCCCCYYCSYFIRFYEHPAKWNDAKYVERFNLSININWVLNQQPADFASYFNWYLSCQRTFARKIAPSGILLRNLFIRTRGFWLQQRASTILNFRAVIAIASLVNCSSSSKLTTSDWAKRRTKKKQYWC